MKIIFTKHLLERMFQRGINKETIVEILKNPDSIVESFSDRKIAVKRIDKIWNIIFVEEKDKLIVLTVYFS